MILIEQDHNTVEKIKKRLNRKGRKQDEKNDQTAALLAVVCYDAGNDDAGFCFCSGGFRRPAGYGQRYSRTQTLATVVSGIRIVADQQGDFRPKKGTSGFRERVSPFHHHQLGQR